MDELYVGLPVLDARAKAEYKRRINDLRQDLKQAEQLNDPQRKTAVQDELHAIADHLASSVGLGTRDRKAFSSAERARSAMTKCIKRAVQEIGMAIPSLGYQLAASIKTEYFCSYLRTRSTQLLGSFRITSARILRTTSVKDQK